MTTIVEFSDMKKLLDLNNDSITDYPDLELLADSVHDSLEEYVGRSLSPVEKSVETGINITLCDMIDLKNLPVKSISYIKLNDELYTGSYGYTGYGIKLDAPFEGSWEVSLKGGFKDIPSDVYRAELMQIIYEFQNINNLAIETFNNDGGSTSGPGYVVLKDNRRLLKRYRHVNTLGF